MEEALEVAKENLRRKSRERIEKVHACLYVLPWQDSYAAARLTLPELFKDLDVDGDPVALAVHRDLVLVTGSEDVAGLALMAVTAEGALDEPYPVSRRTLVLRNFEWSEFVVQKLPLPYKKLALADTAAAYNDQHELLVELMKREGEDVFIGSYMVAEHVEKKSLSTWVTWTNTGVQLLPEAENISFVSVTPDGEPKVLRRVAFDRARAVIGARMQKMPDLDPPRWRVDGFPTEEEFRLMSEQGEES